MYCKYELVFKSWQPKIKKQVLNNNHDVSYVNCSKSRTKTWAAVEEQQIMVQQSKDKQHKQAQT